jgi:hypothetical protein
MISSKIVSLKHTNFDKHTSILRNYGPVIFYSTGPLNRLVYPISTYVGLYKLAGQDYELVLGPIQQRTGYNERLINYFSSTIHNREIAPLHQGFKKCDRV